MFGKALRHISFQVIKLLCTSYHEEGRELIELRDRCELRLANAWSEADVLVTQVLFNKTWIYFLLTKYR